MPVEGTSTVTVHDALTPLVAVAVMIAVPLDFAVIVPSSETLATLLLEDVNVTVSGVSAGVSVAVSRSVCPTFSVTEVLFSVTDVAGTRVVISHVAVFPLVVVAVIVAVPFALAVTTPEAETEAIAGADEVHVTLSVELEGVSVAVSVTVLPR